VAIVSWLVELHGPILLWLGTDTRRRRSLAPRAQDRAFALSSELGLKPGRSRGQPAQQWAPPLEKPYIGVLDGAPAGT